MNPGLPSTYNKLHAEAAESLLAALADGKSLIEIQFPPIPNMATAALNQLLDANRVFTRELIRCLIPKYEPNQLHVLFPDVGEARLAKQAYGDVPFNICVLSDQTPSFIYRRGIALIINPGFNICEWIYIQNLYSSQSKCVLVTVNADLDKVRSSYYPRLFYPRLHKAKNNLLIRFEEIYYIKSFAKGGTLLRRFPYNWTLFYVHKNGIREIWQNEKRPNFSFVERQLAQERTRDLLAK